ncbi:hypothetical protein GQX74_010022 [Glossina fuscipes]|nr:hypothetical protein GQX74_010022 [Glossina fuscipes]
MTIKSVNSQFDMEDEKNKKHEKDELENFHGFNDLNEDTMSVDVKIAAKVDEIGHKVNDINNLKGSFCVGGMLGRVSPHSNPRSSPRAAAFAPGFL